MEQKEHKRGASMVLPTAVLGILMVVMIVFLVSINAKLDKIATGAVVQQPTAQVPTPTPTQAAAPVKVGEGNNPIRGEKTAPVEIIEFSDFQCPYCQNWYDQNMQQLEDKYIKTGKVKFVFRDFPLSFHPYAQKAAEASECAAEQGKFWEMHDSIFTTKKITVDELKQQAKDLGLDTAKFNTCLDSGKTAAAITQDLNDGQAAGVSGTPTFFVNGQKIVGAQPFAVFDTAIQQALGQ
jgi:protein-disulfide isomerase